MEIAPLECVFRDCLESCSNGEKFFSSKALSENQIDVVINSSHKRHDGFAKSLKQSKTILNYHASCYATYIHFKSKIEKYLKAKRKQKRTRRRTQKKTTWKRVSKIHTLICASLFEILFKIQSIVFCIFRLSMDRSSFESQKFCFFLLRRMYS